MSRFHILFSVQGKKITVLDLSTHTKALLSFLIMLGLLLMTLVFI